ncbi:MAG: dihydrodipicolinate reductase, partial [bacterium]|nr:dihydrodipicolinate reductase [bacterium]
REHGSVVLGAGINPGFLMDFLPTVSTAICREVKTVHIERIQDASFRRLPFQQKIGVGLTPEAFQERVDQHKIRHVGLTESMHMIAARMGWDLDKTEEIVKPVIAETDLSGPGWSVSAGMATGVNQTGHGYIGEREVLTLVFRAAVGQTDPQDAIFIDGTPKLNLVIPGGVNGDIATCSIITNAIPVVAEAPPGLRTMADIPPISCFA